MNIGNIFKKPDNEIAEIAAARQQLQRRRTEIEARLRAIAINEDHSGAPGHARRAALETGTPADVVALDRELDELKAERAQIDHRERALNERHDQAKAEAAAAGLRPALKALPRALEACQEAERRLAAARTELNETVSRVYQGRIAGGEDAPGVTDADFVLAVADALNLYDTDARGRYSLPRAILFDRLGCPRPAKFDPNADPRSRDQKERDAAREDNVDTRRHPEQSIWTKKEPGAAA